MTITSAVAVLAGIYPARSETFVRRDVMGLHQRGLAQGVLTLRPGEVGLATDSPTLVVYQGGIKLLLTALRETLLHPLQTLRTLGTALWDAWQPGEATSWWQRGRGLGQALVSISLAGRLREQGLRHLHCHFAHAPTTVGMYTATQLGIGFSFTGHANDLFQRRFLLKRKLQRARFVACISHWHRQLYQSLHSDQPERYPIIRCSVDTDAWHYQAPDAQPWSKVRLLCVCRLVPKKGVDVLLQAMASLARMQPALQVELIVVGEGPQRAAWQSLGKELGLDDKVDWRGAQPHSAVAKTLREAQLFVLPCRTDADGDRDGIPVVLMEAMAAGVPVISGDLPAIRELVIPDVTGLLVEPDQPEQVARAIRQMAEDPRLRLGLAAAARRHVEAEFSEKINLDRLESALKQVLTGTPA